MKNKNINISPMLNVYPDSIGNKLQDLLQFLKMEELKDTFGSIYLLPSLFNTDLDRGFSVIDYELNELMASKEDLEEIKKLGIDLKLDFILNHTSVLSKEFKDITKNGEKSKYIDFFIDWNKFWDGYGEMTEDGYIQPYSEYIDKMHLRKEGLPILFVRYPDGKKVPYWNTFYQKVYYDIPSIESLMETLDIQFGTATLLREKIEYNVNNNIKLQDFDLGEVSFLKEKVAKLLEQNTKYLGQMDLNVNSPLVWDFYKETLEKLSNYGAEVVRLDAFAYVTKEVGKKNFLNEPEVWDILSRVNNIATKENLRLLPEIHSKHEEMVHNIIAKKGYMIYDFFLPGLIIDAFSKNRVEYLVKWINEILDNNYSTVNMLGCHDGIPLLDLKGLLPESEIEGLIKTVVDRGGYVKELHGKKNMYYQVNATFFSALGEDEKQLELARAIQMFMPGKPQVWYLDLFAGKNDLEGFRRAGKDGHKEINRTNLKLEDINANINSDVVKNQIQLINFRNNFEAFNTDAEIKVTANGSEELVLEWSYSGFKAILTANVKDYSYKIESFEN